MADEVNIEVEEVPIQTVEISVDPSAAQQAIDAAEQAQQIADQLAVTPQYLQLKIISKGNPGGIPNVLHTLEVEDIVQGMKENGYFWNSAVYNGGDINDRNNFTELSGFQYK